MVAWLVTWESTGYQSKAEIVAIINYRYPPIKIKDIIELLYINNRLTLSERLKYAKNRKNNPYPAEFESIKGVPWQGRITCGHNPWLYARIVDNLRIEIDTEGNETLKWDERPVPESVM